MLHHTFWRGNQILKVAPYLLKRKSNSECGTIPSEEEIKFWRWHQIFWRGNQILKMAPYLLKRKSNSEGGAIPSEEEIKFWRWCHTFWGGNQILTVAPYLLMRKSNSEGGTIPCRPQCRGRSHCRVPVPQTPQSSGCSWCRCPGRQRWSPPLPWSAASHQVHAPESWATHPHTHWWLNNMGQYYTDIRIGGSTTWDSSTRTYVLVVQQHGTLLHGHTYWWLNNMGHYYTDIHTGGWATRYSITLSYVWYSATRLHLFGETATQ